MKPAVVYPLVATAFLLFLTFSPTPEHRPGKVRLGRCFGCKHAQFDPYIEKIERMMDRGGWNQNDIGSEQHSDSHPVFDWDSNPFSGVIEDPDEYFSEEGQLNITGRLQVLFPWLDRAPQDGMISLEELEAWNIRQATDKLAYRTLREMVEYDKDGDKAITLREYLPHVSDVENIDVNDTVHGQAGWWKEQFLNADVDSNGSLNVTEFNDFLHPEDSNNEKVQLWLLKEKIRGMDFDKDGRLSFIEFHDRAYDVYRSYIEYENDGSNVPNAEEKFVELDKNKDNYLTVEELMPITRQLNPGELSHAKYYTRYLIQQADDDRDGKLTLDEMLDHPYVFYTTVVQESEYDDDDDIHDEFR